MFFFFLNHIKNVDSTATELHCFFLKTHLKCWAEMFCVLIWCPLDFNKEIFYVIF